MIVRIMGEGQLSISDTTVTELNALDSKLSAALDGGDELSFRAALEALIGRLHEVGSPVPAETLSASDLILPPRDATMDEVRQMMTEDGLIPD